MVMQLKFRPGNLVANLMATVAAAAAAVGCISVGLVVVLELLLLLLDFLISASFDKHR